MKSLDKLRTQVKVLMAKNDPAHDFEHILRVYANAEKICYTEKANKKLVLTAVLLHDIVSYPKSDKRSKSSSNKSAQKAKKILQKLPYSDIEIKIIIDAIKNHSFSKNKIPKTIEGKILQDADRLDALGAIGIARTFAVSGAENRSFYNSDDPFCSKRNPNDQQWALDHFFKKLLMLEKKMNTKSGKIEARRRTEIIKNYLNNLKLELKL